MPFIIILIALLAFPAAAQENNVYSAKVLRVVDGDNFHARIDMGLGLSIERSVRIDGVNTPETNSRAKCDEERVLGAQATALTTAFLQANDIRLTRLRLGKYGGRVIASVNGGELAERLIEAGLGREYDGGRRRSWCPTPE